MNVVSDASPIIALSSIDRLDLLRQLFGTVIIPSAVEREIKIERRKDIRDAIDQRWITVRQVASAGIVERLRAKLGAGEAEAISLARELPEPLLLLDDKLARHTARASGLRVAGTLGLLVIASDRGLVSNLDMLVDRLADQGFWVSDSVVHKVLSRRRLS